MDRRHFIALLSSTAAVIPLGGYAQPARKVYRVALVGANGPQATMRELGLSQALMGGMRDLGYIEGENIEYEFRSADGKVAERADEITNELIVKSVDVIVVAAAILAKEMMRYTTKIPIVMGAGGDLIAIGVVSSLSRPGGNVTGFSIQVAPEIDSRRLQLLKEIAPTMNTVAYLGSKSEWETNGEALQSAAKSLGMTLSYVEHSLAGHAEAFQALDHERPNAVVVSSFTSLWVKRQAIHDYALQRRTPIIYPFREFVDTGGLISYGVSLTDQWRRTADYVDKILKGANPGELPIQLPTKFELVISLKVARAIGLEIPAPILAQAAEVIE
jgi:ABC-type uncharacterized transport system substrate-binding protein